MNDAILRKKTNGFYNHFVKRLFDILLSMLLIIVLSPLILILMFLVLLTSGAPVFYAPERGGYHNKPFHIIKFRTMVKDADKIGGGTTAYRDSRITKIGKLLRATKFDEIPQLFNVLMGTMSFIGPRPELLKYVNDYRGLEKYILEVRPGITDFSSMKFVDLQSVVGSSNADEAYEKYVLKEKINLRLEYAMKISFFTDLSIFFKTVILVIMKIFHIRRKDHNHVRLANSSLKVSRICFGGCPMGGYGWGKTNEDDFIEAVHASLDNGINFFDTADIYGLGESEIVLGKAIQGRRSEAIIATKCGCRRKDGKTFYDNSFEYMNEALNESLKRLQTDYIDLFQVHYRDETTPLKDVIGTLESFKKDGRIRAYGFSNIHGKDLEELKEYDKQISSLQNEYSLATRENEDDFFFLNRIGITPLTWGSLGQGILAGRIDENTIFEEGDRRLRPEYVNFHGERFKHNMQMVCVLKELSSEYNRSVSSIAMRFILDYIPNSIVLVGVKNTEQLLANKEALGWHLKKRDLKRLEKIAHFIDTKK
jgi:aryl-alcohol dehydrogenase-like predicted oxidoreductase/lipopolysaccharide/colanic/teichoic acid biosynthesis glycosyltransferase